jgi:hypothetical protein
MLCYGKEHANPCMQMEWKYCIRHEASMLHEIQTLGYKISDKRK